MINQSIKKIFRHPLFIALIFGFIVCSWPFFSFPLTDADVSNWIMSSYKIQKSGEFLTTVSDQGHGPLMAWTGAVFTIPFPDSFYFYNLFNLLCGLLGIILIYFFSQKFWQKKEVSILATYLFVTNIAFIYLTRTPMYDWPATIFYFAFSGFYYLYIKENKASYFMLALLSIGIGSLSRFSICLGLAGIFMFITSFIYKRPLIVIFRDSLLIIGSIIIFNFPWLFSQIKTYDSSFLKAFIIDNTGRYVKSTRPNSYYRKDFYGFSIYTLVGMLPHTFCLIATFFQKGITKRLKSQKESLVLLAGFLPCLMIFSFSGHTKLARYIAYVFPFITMLLAYNLSVFDLKNPNYRKRCQTLLKWVASFLAVILICLICQFENEVKESVLFAVSVIVLLFSLLGLSYYTITKKYNQLIKNATVFLWQYGIIYIVFFSILTHLYIRADFLINVNDMIRNVMQ